MEAQQTPLRTAIMRIMSDMLDSADDDGIYETGRFMDRIEQLLCDMMAADEVMQLSGSEAVMGFLAWLTTRDETTVLGPHQEVDISLYERFVETNHLTEPRETWHELLTHPKEPEPEPVPEAVPAPLEFGRTINPEIRGLILTALADAFNEDEEGPVDEPKDSPIDSEELDRYVEVIRIGGDGSRVIARGTLDEVLFALTESKE